MLKREDLHETIPKRGSNHEGKMLVLAHFLPKQVSTQENGLRFIPVDSRALAEGIASLM